MAIVNSYTGFMPTPDRTSLDEIVEAARALLEHDGPASLTMQAVAHRVGVRAPSLYKRVKSRDELVRLVAEATLADVTNRLSSASSAMELMDIFRAFAKESPAGFQLVMTPGAHSPVARPEFFEAVASGVIRVATELAGEEMALPAARTLTAWANGFISMELSRGFNLGGDVEEAWQFGATRIVEAITIPH
ncbi:MAG: TetR family transcriptional regulator [Glaciihabitans sp.]|nr:TetR family transcriptional regulator [Glaciihabitans sp.]